jgi:tartrate dehydrogenase/decarboxylase / D-malate dehydrogenase
VKHSIAIIPGDGIGQEIMPEALKVLAWAEKTHGIELQLHHKDWAHCNYYLQHGSMMPEDWKTQLEACEAILFGAVGMPHLVPDHISLWGSLLRYRREFDQYVNLRPVKLLPGAPCPLANKQPGDIDFVVVRENTEGEYSAVGGRMFEGTDREIVLQESIFTRHGVDRVLKFAFELAQSRPRKKLTAATKSNGIAISMPYWDERVDNMASAYPGIACDKQHVDILAARFVMHPERFDVVVASNLFGDILSDLGPACTGTIGLAPSANLNPDRTFPSLFEPVHGSAPDIAGKNLANPIAMIWSAALMIQFLGGSPAVQAAGQQAAYQQAHDSILKAIETVLACGDKNQLTPDLKGQGTTQSVGQAILSALG